MHSGRSAQFREQGFLVIPDFKSAEEVAGLRARAAAIIDAFDPDLNRSIFTTNEQERQVDTYFMESADKVRCFLEEEGLSPSSPPPSPSPVSIASAATGASGGC